MWRRVRGGEFVPFTSDAVLCELGELMHRENQTAQAVEAARQIMKSPLFRRVIVPGSLLEAGVALADRWAQKIPNRRKRLGFFDCVNVETMRALGIVRVFATDGDYDHAGLEVVPFRP